MGALLTSCGEEDLLQLRTDRYRGRDICPHEFAHNNRVALADAAAGYGRLWRQGIP